MIVLVDEPVLAAVKLVSHGFKAAFDVGLQADGGNAHGTILETRNGGAFAGVQGARVAVTQRAALGEGLPAVWRP